MALDKVLRSDGATLAPEVLLTPDGVKHDWAIQIEGTGTGIGPASGFPGHALARPSDHPGLVDAHASGPDGQPRIMGTRPDMAAHPAPDGTGWTKNNPICLQMGIL